MSVSYPNGLLFERDKRKKRNNKVEINNDNNNMQVLI